MYLNALLILLPYFCFKHLISRDLLKQRHVKKPGKIYCSTFRGHRDSIIKRLVISYANKEKYKISTEITINGLNNHLSTDGISLHVQSWFTHANV